ncbi:hypothetical protein BGX38DRAFT_1170315 [Terfezia claveryi]|nr:hypothetical protein BGX38DRAFT_1170315 [Terfezia claveryi]
MHNQTFLTTVTLNRSDMDNQLPKSHISRSTSIPAPQATPLEDCPLLYILLSGHGPNVYHRFPLL